MINIMDFAGGARQYSSHHATQQVGGEFVSRVTKECRA